MTQESKLGLKTKGSLTPKTIHPDLTLNLFYLQSELIIYPLNKSNLDILRALHHVFIF